MLNDRWHLKCDLHRRHILLKFTPCRCPFAVMDPQEMYFERQVGEQCGVHAINNAVGGQVLLAETCWVWLPKLQTDTMPTRSFDSHVVHSVGVM